MSLTLEDTGHVLDLLWRLGVLSQQRLGSSTVVAWHAALAGSPLAPSLAECRDAAVALSREDDLGRPVAPSHVLAGVRHQRQRSRVADLTQARLRRELEAGRA